MHKTEGLGVKGLTGTDGETVAYELAVFCELYTSQYLVASIPGVVEQRMADMFHVGADLMGAAGLKHASDK